MAGACALAFCAFGACAEQIRVATYDPALFRKGPGLLLRDILKGNDPQIKAVIAVIAAANPDVLLLTNIDYDPDGHALAALQDALDKAGAPYPVIYAAAPNTGLRTGLDMDGDRKMNTGRDAQGYGTFPGQSGMALLSRVPIAGVEDFSAVLWKDRPGAGALLPQLMPSEVAEVLRLPHTAHWRVTLETEAGLLDLLAYAAGPPVFDGPEDRNGHRNAAETRFWLDHLEAASDPFVILGKANNDPVDGEGHKDAMADLLGHLLVQDVKPRRTGPAAPDGDAGDPALDTVDWARVGQRRADYVLPSTGITVLDAGVLWPSAASAEEQRLADVELARRGLGPIDAQTVAQASPHRLVWLDIKLER